MYLTSLVAKVVAKVPFSPGHEMVGEVRFCVADITSFTDVVDS